MESVNTAESTLADRDLARRASRGEVEALKELNSLCDLVLGRAARRLAPVPADAQDLLQEAKAHLMRPEVIGKYSGQGSLAGFLRIAGMRAMAIVERRAERRGWRERVAYGLEGMPLALEDGNLAAVEDRTDPELYAALERLPERARQVVVSIAVLELSYAETALALGMPIGTVSSTHNRALAALRADLSERSSASKPDGER